MNFRNNPSGWYISYCLLLLITDRSWLAFGYVHSIYRYSIYIIDIYILPDWASRACTYRVLRLFDKTGRGRIRKLDRSLLSHLLWIVFFGTTCPIRSYCWRGRHRCAEPERDWQRRPSGGEVKAKLQLAGCNYGPGIFYVRLRHIVPKLLINQWHYTTAMSTFMWATALAPKSDRCSSTHSILEF